MVLIILNLIGAWIFSLFGFDALVATGMLELFGITITNAGYYFMFALFGMLQSVSLTGGIRGLQWDFRKDFKNARKSKKKDEE